MAGGIRHGGGVEAEPNVIPMIDILLVMLLIFMIAAARVRQIIPVQIPPAERYSGPAPVQIVLSLGTDGGLSLNGHPVPGDRLESVLRASYTGRPSKLLFLQAAPNRIYQEVVSLMDRARGAGIEVVALMPGQPGVREPSLR